MIIEKEVIRPGTYFYRDQVTGKPGKLTVTPDLVKYWHEQGNAMLSSGLTVPVPMEHDFNSHPMTPADRLKANAGWVKEYRLKGDRLFSALDIPDPGIRDKLPGTIRWTSPWINSFTDGKGKEWKNVISHLALTTRPRIVDQEPFGSVAAALSVAEPVGVDDFGDKGLCLSRAGRIVRRKSDDKPCPRYPMAFSLYSGVVLASDDSIPSKKISANDDDYGEMDGGDIPDDDDPNNDDNIDLEPFNDPAGDVSMIELLSDLLGALGISVESSGDEAQFKRELYNAAMTKIHELTNKAQNGDQADSKNRANPPGQPPNNPRPGQPGQNPLIQQEQQPMYMSLEDIQKLDEPLKSVALSMYNETVKANTKAAEAEKILNSLRDAKLKEAADARVKRVSLLGRLSPKVKADLDEMVAMPEMALSMGDGGAVIDPMAQTLAVLEKGLADMPRLLTTEQSALSVQPQPQDADILSDEKATEIADGFARQMGCAPQSKAS